MKQRNFPRHPVTPWTSKFWLLFKFSINDLSQREYSRIVT